MFLNKVLEFNKDLIDVAIDFHNKGFILPDTYVIDLDTLLENANSIINEAKKYNMEMYFMLKQIGRNPLIAKELMKLGYKGAVVVDFKEAKTMIKNNIHISNVGHLVQMPDCMVQKLVDYDCDYFTVYSMDKIKKINECAKNSNKVQNIILRVYDDNDVIYSGQTAGFDIKELNSLIDNIKELDNVKIAGVTSFPCFLYDEKIKDIKETNNLSTVLEAKSILEKHGIRDININAPSTTCVNTIKKMVKYNITSGEPGHGLTGTTPLHAYKECDEKPCVIYLSEISHIFKGNSYCYGGGYYRRSHVSSAIVGKEMKHTSVITPSLESIDYYFGLKDEFKVGAPVVMSFRFQMFVTRSDVCIIKGIKTGKPEILGTYTSLGEING